MGAGAVSSVAVAGTAGLDTMYSRCMVQLSIAGIAINARNRDNDLNT
jgi:hypothetical protein